VILHGGGDSSRESPPYGFWADYLPRHGFADLIYDKRGNGASTGNWRAVGFEERAGDVIAGLEWLHKHEAVDANRLGLLAVSQGSSVAGLVADRFPHLRFIVRVSGPVLPVVEADTTAIMNELRREGWK
jgi:alpha/beta superfamily hydrolase